MRTHASHAHLSWLGGTIEKALLPQAMHGAHLCQQGYAASTFLNCLGVGTVYGLKSWMMLPSLDEPMATALISLQKDYIFNSFWVS
jgi:hypothetical protein